MGWKEMIFVWFGGQMEGYYYYMKPLRAKKSREVQDDRGKGVEHYHIANRSKRVMFMFQDSSFTQENGEDQPDKEETAGRIELGRAYKDTGKRTPKISLVSKRTCDFNVGILDVSNSDFQTDRTEIQRKKEENKLSRKQSLFQHSNHIKAESLVESYNCGLFTACSEPTYEQDGSYFPPPNLKKTESVFIIEHSLHCKESKEVAREKIDLSSSPRCHLTFQKLQKCALGDEPKRYRRKLFDKMESSRCTIFSPSLLEKPKARSRVFSDYSSNSKNSSRCSSQSKHRKILPHLSQDWPNPKKEAFQSIDLPLSILSNLNPSLPSTFPQPQSQQPPRNPDPFPYYH